MPRAQVKKPNTSSKAPATAAGINFDGDDDNLPESPHSSVQDEPGTSKATKKRSYPQEEERDEPDVTNFGSDMQKMLECFGADITKTLMAKRKRLEQYTQASLKTSNKKVEDIWRNQQTERQKLTEEFTRQISTVFTQWDTDLSKSKEQEEKLTNLFRQQQKLFQQARVVQSQRLKTIQQLHETFTKGMENLEKHHHDQHSTVQSELRKEMAVLQKKILMDTQQQEMASVRKSLQTMLF